MLDSYASLTANWSYPTAIRFGAGRIGELADAVKAAGIARPLFVTDPGIAGLPIVAKALAVLDGAGVAYTVFSKVDGNPTLANLDDGLAAYRAGSHDGVIAFGGGSAMDIGKTIAFGYLPVELAGETGFGIEAFGKAYKATRGPRTLYDAKMERLKA